MAYFVKLYGSILTSTIWMLRPERDLFLTALLMARPFVLDHPEPQLCVDSLEETGWVVPPGRYGFAEASGPGIIREAGETDRAAGVEALRRMGEPEPESRSQAHEGRRLARVNHGYIILNYAEYRDYRDLTTAERSKKWRAKRKSNTPDTPMNTEERDASSPVAPTAEPSTFREGTGAPVVTLACVGAGRREFVVRESLAAEWRASYPGVAVDDELRRAVQWCADNPTRRKTFAGARRFLSSWLARVQDGPQAKGNGHAAPVSSGCPEWDEVLGAYHAISPETEEQLRAAVTPSVAGGVLRLQAVDEFRAAYVERHVEDIRARCSLPVLITSEDSTQGDMPF